MIPENGGTIYNPLRASEIPKERIAPSEDRWKYFIPDSKKVADAVHELGIDFISIDDIGSAASLPDAIVLGSKDTLEFKLRKKKEEGEKSGKSSKFMKTLRKSRTQSENLVFLIEEEGVSLNKIMVEYVRRYAYANSLVLGLNIEGEAVLWINGK